MQRPPATMEEQLFLKAIREECPWDSLPKRLQSTLNSKEEWHRRIIDHCIKKRLPWKTSFARKVCKEGEYYEEMMNYLRRNLALFPYHLAEHVCRIMRISPFKYYCDMLFEVMKSEQPYDSIPNFSAADALRLTGIGRNEFIDIMNKCRSKLLQTDLLNEHHEAMQDLRGRLLYVCAEYQATGPAAKLLYQKDHNKERDTSRPLMTYASRRWNPVADPSSPILGVLSENQRLKLANRQRSGTEVLSFDGSILRSHSLSPIHEAGSRPLEDPVPIETGKVESDDVDSKEVTLPGVNLLFDGSELHPFDIGACLQARQPVFLIGEASAAASASLTAKQKV